MTQISPTGKGEAWPQEMAKGDEEAADQAVRESHKGLWLVGAIAGLETLALIVLGILVVSNSGKAKDCTLHLPDSYFPSTPTTPIYLPADPPIVAPDPGPPPPPYPDFITECNAWAEQAGFPGWECPQPFPKFTESTEAHPECKVVVVGAGTGGLYTALRLIDTDTVAPSDICVFEMTDRVGGRLFSLRGMGPNRDLNVDAGGYRSWPEFTPVLHALITEYLGLPMKCYYAEEDPCRRFIIADGEGNSAGFTTFVETMMQRLTDRGVRFFPWHEAVSLSKAEGEAKTTIGFANGNSAIATDNVILNIPQRPLLMLLRNSTLPEGALSKRDWMGLHSVSGEIATKLYLYYPRAWWRELGIGDGDFIADGDAQTMLLKGRYHDGDVKCTDPADLSTCHGFLLAVYAHDFSGESAIFFRRFQAERPTPITIIPNTTVEGAMFLEKAHESLSNYHKYAGREGRDYTYTDAVRLVERGPKPYFGVMATWSTATRGAGTGWHGWTDLKYKEEAEAPLAELGIYTINEAYSNLQGWAEGALQRADEVLSKRWGVATPWSFEVEDRRQIVRQTVAVPVVCEDEGSTPSGGGGGGGGGDGGGGGGDDILCFGGDARLAMADGSTRALRDAAVGDRVMTGSGVGTVTAKLVHPVGAARDVAVVRDAEGGELVGSLTHPVLVGGAWVELAEAIAAGALPHNGTIESRYVDAFYNLEVDGDRPGASPHAYVVNGIVASGNGDSPVLNSLFPRQNSWRAKVAESGADPAAAAPFAAHPLRAAAAGAAMAS